MYLLNLLVLECLKKEFCMEFESSSTASGIPNSITEVCLVPQSLANFSRQIRSY